MQFWHETVEGPQAPYQGESDYVAHLRNGCGLAPKIALPL